MLVFTLMGGVGDDVDVDDDVVVVVNDDDDDDGDDDGFWFSCGLALEILRMGWR